MIIASLPKNGKAYFHWMHIVYLGSDRIHLEAFEDGEEIPDEGMCMFKFYSNALTL